MMRLALLFMVSTAALALPMPTGTIVRAPHAERLKWSPAARHEAMLADLTDSMTGPASNDTIATTPYVSPERYGLCRRDVVQLSYVPVRGDNYRGPLKPAGIRSVRAQYHFLGRIDGRPRDQWQNECERLSADKIYWAYASNDREADDALSRLTEAVADVRRNERLNASRAANPDKDRVTIDCAPLDDPEVAARCTVAFLDAATRVSRAGNCTEQSENCYEFTMGGYQVTIVTTYAKLAKDGYSTTIRVARDADIIT